MAVAASALVVLGLAACSQKANASGDAKSFYKGKTITYIVPQPPGGSYAAALLPALPIVEKELGAKINPVYIKQGTSIVGQDRIAQSKPDGLTIGTLSVSADLPIVLAGQNLLNFDLTKQSLIAGNLLSPEVIVACKGSPYTSIDQVLHATQPFKVINTGQGPGYELVKVLFNAYGAPVKSLSGYEDSASQTTGCLRGDAPLALQTVAALTPQDFAQGLVHGLVITTAQSPSSVFYQYLKDTPTLAQLISSEPPTDPQGQQVLDLIGEQYGSTALGVIVAGPKGIPADRLAVLQAAFKKAYTDPGVAAAMTKSGILPGYVAPSQAVPYMQKLLTNKDIIQSFINK
jgi:tripartite-type tricarboxylate transporter receptor subunit TctC